MLSNDTRLADLRFVHLLMGEDRETTTYLLHKADVEKLIEAKLKLHYDPGVNPHNGKATTPVMEIRVAVPQIGEPLWWTAPSLRSGDPNGAPLVHQDYDMQTVWRRPDIQSLYDQEEQERLEVEAGA